MKKRNGVVRYNGNGQASATLSSFARFNRHDQVKLKKSLSLPGARLKAGMCAWVRSANVTPMVDISVPGVTESIMVQADLLKWVSSIGGQA